MKKMKLYTSVAAALLFATTAIAQPKATGETVGNIEMTDIDGNSFSLYDYLDQGYTVVIDVSATWCGPCWMFHNTHTMEKLYEKYGPEGTVTAGKIMPIFLEGDPDTDEADIEGTGSSTQGNWKEGSSYHIVDAPSFDYYLNALYQPGTMYINYPSFWVICPDRKIKLSQEGSGGAITESGIVALAEGCSPTNINEVVDAKSISIYPNPANDHINIAYTASASSKATLTITSITGQVLHNEDFNMINGSQSKAVNIEQLPSGMYIVTLGTDSGELIRRKITKR